MGITLSEKATFMAVIGLSALIGFLNHVFWLVTMGGIGLLWYRRRLISRGL